jgi:hypothetical protein
VGYIGPSVYTGTLAITKSVTLDGAWTAACINPGVCRFDAAVCVPQNVVLDAQGNGRAISITGEIAPTIQCFTITGGDADGLGGDPDGYHAGGGIYSKDAAPVIVGNIITGNYGCRVCSAYGRGGGVYLLNAPATAIISGNVIAHNAGAGTILGSGGGIVLRNSNAQVLSNTIQRNTGGTAGDGGGLYVLNGSPTIADNEILSNTAAGSGVMGQGGGVFVRSSTPVTIVRNAVLFNVALRGTADPALFSRGGGLYYEGPGAFIRDNTLRSNAATFGGAGLGGGMYLRNLSASAVVSGNVVADNNRASYGDRGDGGGIYLDGCQAAVTGNQVSGNVASSSGTGYGGGLYVNGGGGLIQGNGFTANLALLGAVSGYGYGGGVAISNSVAIVQDNLIAQNSAASAPGTISAGGGLYVYQGAPQIVRNDVLSNATGNGNSGVGGGLYVESARPLVDGNTILDNRALGGAYSRGGGVRIASCPAFTLTNNVVARNAVSATGSGVAVAVSTGRLAYNTIADNRTGDGVGVLVESSSRITLTNTIIANQAVGISRASGTFATAEYTLFDGNGLNYNAGVNSTNQIPGPAALRTDYHLKNWSAALDRATPLAWVTSDVDGQARPFGAGYDVGADEASCNRFVLNTDGNDTGNDCADQAHPCRTVLRALDQAADGDTICVADNPLQPGPSVYAGVHTVDRSVTLDGAWQAACVDPHDLTCSFWPVPCNPANVVLDAQRAGRVLRVTSNTTPTIYCFTVTGGQVVGENGGGILAEDAAPVVSSNLITGNLALNGTGGGICISGGTPVITANTIVSNLAAYGGGGVRLGGGRVVLYGNLIADNQSNYGGGVHLDQAWVTATANLVMRNRADSAWSTAAVPGNHFVALNNVLAYNSGMAFSIYVYQATLLHNTIVSNAVYGVRGAYTATITLTDNIIAYNANDSITAWAGASVIADHNLFWGNASDPFTGTGAVLANPLLLPDGYHLGTGSPAVNAGVNAGVATDVDGDVRPSGAGYDIGADERVSYGYLPVVLRDY